MSVDPTIQIVVRGKVFRGRHFHHLYNALNKLEGRDELNKDERTILAHMERILEEHYRSTSPGTITSALPSLDELERRMR